LAAARVTALRTEHLIRPRNCLDTRAGDLRMATVSPGAKVLVVGNGAIQFLAARIAALRGFDVTVACVPQAMETGKSLIYDDTHPENSLPIKLLPIAGDEAVAADVDAAVEQNEGLIIAFDGEQTIPDQALSVFMPPAGGKKLKHVALMSRYLNGKGMGFVPAAAKVAANNEIWAGSNEAVAEYRKMEESVVARASKIGVTHTIIRAGTLKGGASGDVLNGGGGCADFLNPVFYKFGQQDVANWRLLFDCDALGVEVVKGDTLPGPGFTAALTATTPTGGDGDSHRGGVATALVESLRVGAAADADFSIKSAAGREFPSAEKWEQLFASA